MEVFLGMALGGLGSWIVVRGRPVPVPTVVSQSGRDQALIRLLQGAQRSVLMKVESLTLVPVGNELAQALQRKVSVNLELPLGAATDLEVSRIARLLMDLGAQVSFRGGSTERFRGALVVVDGDRFLYSAGPLERVAPDSEVAFVTGPVGDSKGRVP